MEIDLVYLWCDGSDPIWRGKRESYMPANQCKDQQTFCEGRIINNNELLYSLRSVEMYAPWINHIFIVTDNQVPKWLDITNNKITIVNQNDILPRNAIPTFNSCAIELCIHKIEGLSEYYIYANDDMMFYQHVSPSFFFTSLGKIKSRFYKTNFTLSKQGEEGTYAHTIRCANKLISTEYNLLNIVGLYPHHNIDAYKKKSVISCLNKYKSWSDLTINNKFRNPMDMQRHILSLYAVAEGEAIPIVRKSRRNILGLIKLILISLRIIKRSNSEVFLLNRSCTEMRWILKALRPYLVCFNDGEFTTNSDRTKIKNLLEQLYPNKSQYER